MPDNYIYLESMNQPGTYLGFDVRGNPRKPRELGPTEVDAQFFVRILVSKGRERERERGREKETERGREREKATLLMSKF